MQPPVSTASSSTSTRLTTSGAPPVLVWFRDDLRLDDHPALAAAAATGAPVVPVYVLPADAGCEWAMGSAARWWLHHSLLALGRDLAVCGSRLVLRTGDPARVLPALAEGAGARAVYWNRSYEPGASQVETRLRVELANQGITHQTCGGGVLFEPESIATRAGLPFRVFTPFWKACRDQGDPVSPCSAPKELPSPQARPRSDDLHTWNLLPHIDWAGGFRSTWQPGEAGGAVRLRAFLEGALAEYPVARDFPAQEGGSRLSPHLRFGEISPRRVWEQVRQAVRERPELEAAASAYLRELGWREFAVHLLHHFPHTPDRPLNSEFSRFSWLEDAVALRAWQQGRTGYPLVDAGMRQLWATGWKHNRVRMVVASFLVKDLLLPWQSGARWFWDTLVDADLANNTLGWQWSAGCGADAAPYFRIFNPVSQGEKFDASGEYIRRWVPELAELQSPWVHRPWEAPPLLLRAAGVELGVDYPRPIVDHGRARQRALAAFQQLKR